MKITPLILLAILSLFTLQPPTHAQLKDDTTLKQEMKSYPHKVVYETYQNNNWEIFMSNPDGTNPVNLTNTPDTNELYPHTSPDGKKLTFVVDKGKYGSPKARSVYLMDIDGTNRKLISHNARQACWSPDSKQIAFLKNEYGNRFSAQDFATKGIYIYNLKTAKITQHPNKSIKHLYNLCWSPDSKWFLATVHAGMGYKHAMLAIQANGQKVINLKCKGCRPDISPDGKKIAWGNTDWDLYAADIDFSGPVPKVTNRHPVIKSKAPIKVYHIDWAPDSRYITFSSGPKTKRIGLANEIVGAKANKWDIYVADSTKLNRLIKITNTGKCNKEPDWLKKDKK